MVTSRYGHSRYGRSRYGRSRYSRCALILIRLQNWNFDFDIGIVISVFEFEFPSIFHLNKSKFLIRLLTIISTNNFIKSLNFDRNLDRNSDEINLGGNHRSEAAP
jgi:hypothetical protein